MDNDSTRNDNPLSLAERARQGLLLSEPTLRLDDIAELECPEYRYGPKMEAWIKRLETACKYGALRLKPGDVFDEFGGWPYILREAYQAWRVTQRDLPTDSVIDLWLGATPTAKSIPPESPLPLNERARLGLLVAETELPVWEILELEFPTKSSQQRSEYADWQETIESALRRGLLISRPETRITQGETCPTGIFWADRESYRQLRASKANPPTDSDIHLWLGATPADESIPPVETSLPELPVSSPRHAKLTPCQKDRLDCQTIARELWLEHPNWIQADLLKHRRIKPYLTQWTGKHTVPNWLSEVDPRPDDKRQGRPPTTPA